MLLTKENDYAVRIIQCLKDGRKYSVKEICEQEGIPEPFAYKILKKLAHASIVKVIRGAQGGYLLNVPLEELSLMSIIEIIDPRFGITHCTKPGARCERKKGQSICSIGQEYQRIQQLLKQELQRSSLQVLFQ